MRTRRCRRGFTLVELLVVITILGMLMAMMFPALGAVLETVRQGTCKANLKAIAVAMDQYAGLNNNVYPGLVEGRGVSGQYPKGRRVTWGTCLLMAMDEPLYKTWTDPTGADEVMKVEHIKTYVCPSDVSDPESKQQLSYVINAGHSHDAADADIAGGRPANKSPEYLNRLSGSGVAFNRFCVKPSTFPYKVQKTQFKEPGKLILFSENIQAWNWADKRLSGDTSPQPYDNYGGAAPLPKTNPVAKEAQMYTGFVWNSPFPINRGQGEEDIQQTHKAERWEHARPSSFHPGIVMVVYASHETANLRDDIDPEEFKLLCLPNKTNAMKAQTWKPKR